MKPPNFLRDSFAMSHVAKHEDYLIQDCVRTMLDDYARERDERNAMRRGRLTESGRAALLHVGVGLVMGAMLVAGGVYAYRVAIAAAIRGVAP